MAYERINKIITPRLDEKRLLDIQELSMYLSIGRTKLFYMAQENGWVVKVGSKNLYDRLKVDQWVNEQMQEA